MSNLRSDCRDLIKDLPPGDVYRAHIDRLCCQIDDIEERWHTAERRAFYLGSRIELWNWLIDKRCTVQENSVVGAPRFGVLDVDGEVIGVGHHPETAIEDAQARMTRTATELNLTIEKIEAMINEWAHVGGGRQRELAAKIVERFSWLHAAARGT